MFSIYKSNRLDILINQACDIIKKNPLSEPLQNEIFLVQNIETTQWIKIFIANKLKISANIKFFTTSDFIWKLFKMIDPDVISKKKYYHSSITWYITKLIEEKKITDFINKKDSQLKKIMFASYLSKLFRKYLVYRPDLISSLRKKNQYFKKNKEQTWQEKLWYELIHSYIKNSKYFDFLNLSSILLKKIETSRTKLSFIPFRFFICNISDIPISYLSLLYSLSKYYQINLLMITPYMNHEFFIKKEKNKKKSNIYITSKKKYYNLYEQCYKLNIIDQVNPILLSCGGYGYEYSYFLLSMQNKYINCYTNTYKNNLLNYIQKNILQSINKKNKNQDKNFTNKKMILNPKDNSISIHICCNIQREVEVLHDNLLSLFNKNSSLFPIDIIIKTFRLPLYVPFIKNVFNSVPIKHYIPFIIFNEVPDQHHEILSILKKLFNLEKNRLYNKEIFELLQSNILAKKFHIDKKDIPILFNLIYKSGIRWGIDEEHMNNLLLPTNVQHTWEHGIKRIMLGYATNHQESSWNDTVPYNINNKSNIKVICKIIYLIKILHKWKKKLSTCKLLKTWLPLCRKLIDDFFYINSDTENILDKIEKIWVKIIHTGMKSNYKKKFLFQYCVINFFLMSFI
ncbi:exodeoxyribonuclease V subunit gamma [Buchnera aphidicola]|uniref:exodeoxyribonuclease V subunit gamma n=1 Tax=Buchnera aphidicola TaxID=9 RepID=UPI003464BB9D